jgi:hypothetical protein
VSPYFGSFIISLGLSVIVIGSCGIMLEPERHQVPRNSLFASAVLLLWHENQKKNPTAAATAVRANLTLASFHIMCGPLCELGPRLTLEVLGGVSLTLLWKWGTTHKGVDEFFVRRLPTGARLSARHDQQHRVIVKVPGSAGWLTIIYYTRTFAGGE